MTRFAWVMATYFATIGVAISAFVEMPSRLIWNASTSAPIGLYAVQPPDGIEITDLAVIVPPETVSSFLSRGGYIPRGVPLMKRLLALPGQRVCRENRMESPWAWRENATAVAAICRNGRAALRFTTARFSS